MQISYSFLTLLMSGTILNIIQDNPYGLTGNTFLLSVNLIIVVVKNYNYLYFCNALKYRIINFYFGCYRVFVQIILIKIFINFTLRIHLYLSDKDVFVKNLNKRVM